MTRELAGILGPVVTVFDASGELERLGFERNVKAHLAAGLDGIVVTGSTGEAPLLDEVERQRAIEWARPLVPSDRWLIAGTGAESTRQAVQRARAAGARGADAVLVVSPHYYSGMMDAAALRAHFTRVADESPVPVLLYNIPKYAHFAIPPELVAELATHGNVIGIKDSSGDLALLERYLAAQSSTFAVLTGSGSTLLPALTLGARGGILAVALFAAPLVMALVDALEAGDVEAARQAQERLAPLATHVVGTLGVAGVKAAMDLVGLDGGPVRPPLLPLDSAAEAHVAELLRRAEPVGIA